LPLAAACTIAHGTTVLLLSRSILTEKLARRGQHVTREYAIDPFEYLLVEQVMAQPVEHFAADRPVSEIAEFFIAPGMPARHKSYPVVDQAGALVGMVARAELLRWIAERTPPDARVRDLVSDEPLVVGHEDEIVGRLADRMANADVSRVPIVSRADSALVGLVARRDLLRARARASEHEFSRERLISLWPTAQSNPKDSRKEPIARLAMRVLRIAIGRATRARPRTP
jgi:CIC family chloride channel protein